MASTRKFNCFHVEGTLAQLDERLNQLPVEWEVVSVSHCDNFVYVEGPNRGRANGRYVFLVTVNKHEQ